MDAPNSNAKGGYAWRRGVLPAGVLSETPPFRVVTGNQLARSLWTDDEMRHWATIFGGLNCKANTRAQYVSVYEDYWQGVRCVGGSLPQNTTKTVDIDHSGFLRIRT